MHSSLKRILLLLFAGINLTVAAQKLSVADLRCEYSTNPAGVDAPAPKLSWELQSTQSNVLQTAYQVLVSDDSLSLEKNTGNYWDSKKINSSTSIQVKYRGKALQSAKKYFWKVKAWDNKGNVSEWSAVASWQMGLLNSEDWKNARWIGYEEIADSGKIVPLAHGRGKKSWGERKNRLPLLRKTFNVTKPVKQATVFVCGLGQFEMSINGKKTGDHFLDPGWTQYSRHALYVTFDITDQLQAGDNAIGIMLGNGFYYIPGERYRKLTGAYGNPKAIARMLIEYTDGSSSEIVTDGSWKTSPSPVIFSSIYGGEDYDATKEQAGWNTAAFDDSQWKPAIITTGVPLLQSQTAEPVKVMERFQPVSKKQLADDAWVYDLGQNFSGIPAITVSGKKGDTVRIAPGELLEADGSVNQKGSGGPYYFTYILKGEGEEQWQPKFSYYGFRYLQVTNASLIKKIEGLHIRNAARTTGTFSSSNTLFNKTHALIDWAIKSNTVSVFTDCPHREKLGWLEQTHLMGSSVQYNYDIASLCRKVIRDMMNAQTSEGLVPEIAPEYVQFEDPFRDSPEWGSAAILVPWYNYQWYGDKETLAEAYDMMKRYIGYLQTKAVNNILSQGLGDWYDIGPERPGFSQLTPKGITATAMYYHDLVLMTQIATVLSKPGDVAGYKLLAKKVKDSFNTSFFNTTGFYYGTNSQTANAMALHMGLVESKYRDSVLANLVKDVRNRNNALTAGDIGYRYVLRALEEGGRSDIIAAMNNRSDVPGYGYQLAHGATALTESWQALPDVSNNHFMLGHLMEWFYSGLCGIKAADDAIAYNKIVIRPQPVEGVNQAKASFQSPYGPIKTDWTVKDRQFTIDITIPVNTTAVLYLPPNQRYASPLRLGSGVHHYSVLLK